MSASPRSAVEAAFRYARHGWRVLPVHGIRHDGNCTCGRSDCPRAGKHPWTARGCLDATADLRTIDAWWSRRPLANVAIATGAGLVVLDHDPRSGGDDGLATLRAEHGDLPATPTVRTGSGGTHWYFAHRGGRVGNRAGLYPGIDVRADGGFVVAPPSVHRSGNRYEWMRGAAMLAPVPEWLIAACRPAPPAATRLPQLRLDEMSATFRRMSAWLAHTERSIQGQNGSAALMRALGKIVAQGLGGDDEWTLVVEYNATMCDPPWSVAELVHALGNARRERRGTRLEERRWASP